MKIREHGIYVALGVVLVGFLFILSTTNPAARFGQFYDDALYLSLGKALAQGDGFVMPSLPGAPPSTKYPILYPWLLSWIWRWIPEYPDNVGAATALTAFAACVYLVAVFFLFRRWRSISQWTAVAIVAVCAFHRDFLFQSGQITTEIPFAALMLACLLCAELGAEEERDSSWFWIAGIVAGLCVLIRTAGIAVPAGIGFFLLLQGRRKDLVRLSAGVVPCVLGVALWNAVHRPVIPPDAPPGWVQTWFFYTSYIDFWLVSVKSAPILWDVVTTNIDTIFMQVSKLTLLHDLGPHSLITRAAAFTLSVGILSGVVRQAREDRWRPIHIVFALKLVLVIFWSWSIAGRIFVAFLPLFYVGLLTETRHLSKAIVKPFQVGGRPSERVLAGVLCLPIGWLIWTGATNYVKGLRPPGSAILLGQLSAKDWAEFDDWVNENLPADTIFLADLDARLYLETGHQAIFPMAPTDDLYYNPEAPESRAQFVHFMDVARYLRIRYWVVDARVQATNVQELDELVGAFHAGLPEVFRTESDALRVLDLRCILEDGWDACGDLLRRVTPERGLLE